MCGTRVTVLNLPSPDLYKDVNIFLNTLILAAATPGTVPVVITTLEGNLLGETTFRYTDGYEERLAERIVFDPAAQRSVVRKMHE